jgi:hypothetical protein
VRALRHPGVSYSASGSRRFGSSALEAHDKIFAMLSSNGHFVVKLPNARVDALVAGGGRRAVRGEPGRPMREWLEVHSESQAEWLERAREAVEFVGT